MQDDESRGRELVGKCPIIPSDDDTMGCWYRMRGISMTDLVAFIGVSVMVPKIVAQKSSLLSLLVVVLLRLRSGEFPSLASHLGSR